MPRALALCLVLTSCGDTKPDTPAPTPAPSPRAEAAEPPDPTPPRPARPAMARESWFVQRVSADGKKVLLRDTTRDAQGREPLRYRVILTDANTIESDVSLPALAALPLETLLDSGGEKPGAKLDLNDPAISSELIKIGPILAPFALGHGGRIAASPDGAHVAFNAGDWILTAERGVIGARLSTAASYDPWFTPDGKTLIYRRMTGTFDGIEGKYELYATSVDGTAKPSRIAGTAGAWEPFVATKDAVRFIATAGPHAKTCVVEVPLVAPFKAKRLGCVGGGAIRTSSCVLSPSATWAACSTVQELAEDDPNSTITVRGKTRHSKKLEFAMTSFEVATGKVGFSQVGLGSVSAISDDGKLVVHRSQQLLLIDPAGASHELHPQGYVSLFTYFTDATHLITEQHGDIVVLDITR
ncbi:MAG: hypothetical protein HOV81_09080 [Kofleriaceae bacterium]|nr:hypothetical protein [Kofleriaceae bacterium]